MRRTPLKRSTKGLKRTPLSRASTKQRKRLVAYSRARKDYLAEHPVCEVCKRRKATEIHHKAGRGSKTADPGYFLATCRICHRHIHDNPSWAREHGYLI